MRRALVTSTAIHVAIGLAAVLLVRSAAPDTPTPQETTAEMVFDDPGASLAATPQPQRQPPPPPAATDAASAAWPSFPAAEAGEPVPPAAQPPRQAATPSPPSPAQGPPAVPPKAAVPARAADPPQVRLGNDDPDGSTSDVRGEDVPVGPDPAAPNIPPRYPLEAVRHGEQGVVVLEVAVTPGGGASGVDVYVSSGSAALDRAARDAVARWRFKPKLDGDRPVPAHTLIRVSFRLD